MPGLGVRAPHLGLGLPSSAPVYVMFHRIHAAAGAVNLMLVTFLVPVTAILIGTLIPGPRNAQAFAKAWRLSFVKADRFVDEFVYKPKTGLLLPFKTFPKKATYPAPDSLRL